jgi:hypothetical protein
VDPQKSAQPPSDEGKRYPDGQADEDEQQDRKILLKH